MTSIEWLIDRLYQHEHHIDILDVATINGYFEQAKETHKQEIIDAYCNGNDLIGVEQYYQETFVSKGSDDISFQTERMYSEEEVIKFGEMIAWNMVGKTITESFIRTVSKELFKKYIESLKQPKK
jgi:hypothetical protein